MNNINDNTVENVNKVVIINENEFNNTNKNITNNVNKVVIVNENEFNTANKENLSIDKMNYNNSNPSNNQNTIPFILNNNQEKKVI